MSFEKTSYHMQVLGIDKKNKPCRVWVDAYAILNELEASEEVKHTVKKLLASGARSGGKSHIKDIDECIWQLKKEKQRVEFEEEIENS